MVETMFGNIEIKGDEIGYEVDFRFVSDFEEDPTYLFHLDEKNLDRMIHTLTKIRDRFKEVSRKRKEIMEHTNFTKIYNEMDEKYNPYPVQMSRAEAFGHAFRDGLIDAETYAAAREYYGRLWNYVGD